MDQAPGSSLPKLVFEKAIDLTPPRMLNSEAYIGTYTFVHVVYIQHFMILNMSSPFSQQHAERAFQKSWIHGQILLGIV